MKKLSIRRRGKTMAVMVFLILTLLSSGLIAQDFQFIYFMDYYGGIEPSDGYENLRSRIFMRPTFSGFHDESGLKWTLSVNLWSQLLGEESSVDLWDIPFETYLFLPLGAFDITLGQKLISYGFADLFGPLNVLHSTKRGTLSIDEKYDSRRPDPLFQVKYYPSYEDTIELTYVPITRPDAERQGPVSLPGSLDSVHWVAEPYITDNLHSIFVNYSHYGEKFDLQFLYGWYTENTPDFEITAVDSETATIIQAVYNKKHSFAAAYSTRLGNTTLSQDFAFNLTSDLDGKDMGAQNSDITINTQLLVNLKGGILSQFSLVYSYFFNYGNHDPESDQEAADYLAEEIQNFHTQPQQHIAFVVGHFEKAFLRERLKTQLNIGFFFSPHLLFTPRIAYALSDYWTFEAGMDYTLGEPAELDFRRNPVNDNFYLRLLFQF